MNILYDRYDFNIIQCPISVLDRRINSSDLLNRINKDGKEKYGSRAWSSMIVKRMEDLNNINFRADGFPEELVDNEVEQKGYEL